MISRANYFMKTGSYTGDGIDDKSITGLGFRPQFVIVKGGNNRAVFKIDLMARDTTSSLNATADGTNMIQELLSDGFQVGTDARVNTNGTVYYWMAFAGSSGQNYFRTFIYTGDGADDRNLTGISLGFTPSIAWVKTSAQSMVCRTSVMGADNSFNFISAADTTNAIQSLISGGIQIGTDATVNTSAGAYKGVAFKILSGYIAVGTYTGNGVDDRAITGVGFQPGFVVVKAAVANGTASLKPSALAGDSTLYAGATSAAANIIQSLDVDGFTVGTDVTVNTNGTTYWWIAFREGSFNIPLSRTLTS